MKWVVNDGDGNRVSATINDVTILFPERPAWLDIPYIGRKWQRDLRTEIHCLGTVRYQAGTTPTNYACTGQYSYTADFGLMFYNARWYDSYLNQWTQPDTIMPDQSNPQSWNRYSYALNNPIRYNDPSGHKPCDDEYGCSGPAPAPTPIPPSVPTSLDTTKLTTSSKITGIGGAQLYYLYLQLWREKTDSDGFSSWWWLTFGSDGDFSIWDFISLTSHYEAGGLTQYSSTLAEAGVRWYYGGHCPISQGCGTTEDILNWWGAYSQSAAGLYNAVQGGATLDQAFYQFVGTDAGEMRVFGNSFQNPPSAWKQGWVSGRPYGWANTGFGIWTPNALRMFRKYPDALFVQYQTFIVPSGCAWSNWQNLGNQAYCPAVR